MRIENRGRIPGGNIRQYKEVVYPSLDATIGYRAVDAMERRLRDKRKNEKYLQKKRQQKGQSDKS